MTSKEYESMDANLTLQGHAVEMHDTSPKSRLSLLNIAAIVMGGLVLAYLLYHSVTAPGHGEAPAGEPHEPPPLWAVFPFAALLLSIAVLPIVPATAHWWEHNKNRLGVSLAFAGLTLLYYLFAEGAESIVPVLDHAIIQEYIPFIVLLFSLYVISGGIRLKGDLAAHPSTNTAFIGVGALLASFIGTTGASMLLIRPLLKTNSEREHVTHTVIFFIFLVSNVGGCLLPIGDPPLFLGYLKGVPFWWTLHLWPEWLFATAVLLAVYYVWDRIAYKRETKSHIRADETQRARLALSGGLNLVWLVGIVFCVALIQPGKPIAGTSFVAFPFMREVLMLGLTGLSLVCTSKLIRVENKFNYHAIAEVAALFIGIFICMQVPVEILHAKGAQLGLSEPWQFFWATGTLSSFLDNAPTYVVFFETAKVLPAGEHVVELTTSGTIGFELLIAVSLGAVFMGAMTYIGNGPNFMVKSIAEQSGVKMPSFFGFMIYSGLVLIPVFLVVVLIFM